ncbi:MAG: metal-sulfur cluster assembly factor [Limnochordales bacterium]
MAVTAEQVLEALKQVKDPELGFDIVNLGLVYDVQVDGGKVHVDMTLTSPACMAGPIIAEEARLAVEKLVALANDWVAQSQTRQALSGQKILASPPKTPQAVRATIQSETRQWAEVLKTAKVEPQAY